jgi:predicted nucleotide-binding protein
MYSLFVTLGEGAWDENGHHVEHVSRFLEFTDDLIKQRFKPLTDETEKLLMTFPALFTYEDTVGGDAQVGWITSIQRRRGEIRVAFQLDKSIAPISPREFGSMAWDLDIGNEMERSHWALKDVDLLDVLRKHRGAMPLATFSRKTILAATDVLQAKLSHAEFDRFLLEIGLSETVALKSLGSMLKRSNSLVQYSLTHGDRMTESGLPLAVAIVRRAAEADLVPDRALLVGGMPQKRHTGFWKGLEDDGYAFTDGEIIRTGDAVPMAPPAGSEVAPAVTVPPPPLIVVQALHALEGGIGISVSAGGSVPVASAVAATSQSAKVFLVHGRDDAAKEQVARFLEKLGLEPIILHERPNRGRTLISKFREESADIKFAVVLMTPDDVGGLPNDSPKPRARQNVIFELGFFIGKLGAEHVCTLVGGDMEKPSDFDAVVYVKYGPNTNWKHELARELDGAGIAFDPRKLIF